VSTQPAQASALSPAAGGIGTRASDADRDRAAGVLNAAFAEGRLTAEEYSQRLDAAYAARTWQQLRQLTADLPAPPAAAVERTASPRMSSGPDLCLLCGLLIVCPPAGIAWWLLSRRRPPAPSAGEPG
jgi:Domain of unknown function (DUF1707)